MYDADTAQNIIAPGQDLNELRVDRDLICPTCGKGMRSKVSTLGYRDTKPGYIHIRVNTRVHAEDMYI